MKTLDLASTNHLLRFLRPFSSKTTIWGKNKQSRSIFMALLAKKINSKVDANESYVSIGVRGLVQIILDHSCNSNWFNDENDDYVTSSQMCNNRFHLSQWESDQAIKGVISFSFSYASINKLTTRTARKMTFCSLRLRGLNHDAYLFSICIIDVGKKLTPDIKYVHWTRRWC